jgi:hypothetical protein
VYGFDAFERRCVLCFYGLGDPANLLAIFVYMLMFSLFYFFGFVDVPLSICLLKVQKTFSGNPINIPTGRLGRKRLGLREQAHAFAEGA